MPPPPPPPPPPPLLLLLLLLLLQAAPSWQIGDCGHCTCDQLTITCNYRMSASVTSLADFAPSSTEVSRLGFSPLKFLELYINCQNAPALRSQRLTRSLLRGFDNISHVTVVKCDLVDIDADAFADVRKLSEFDASDNRLRRLPPRLLAGKSMSVVKLSENSRIALLPESFAGATLRRLILSKCELTEFPLSSLRRIRGLESLTLSHNRLQFVPKAAEGIVKGLKYFYLDGNPISCTCPNRWLRDAVSWQTVSPPVAKAQGPQASKTPKCGSPYKVLDIDITKLSSSDFSCSAPQIRAVEVHLDSSAAQLVCSAWTDQPSPLEWQYRHQPLQPPPPFAVAYPQVAYQATGSSFRKRLRRTEGFASELYSVSATNRDGLSANFSLTVRWPPTTSRRKSTATVGKKEKMEEEEKKEKGEEEEEEGRAASAKKRANYFSRKQFTLVEMIIAVIGTFLSTTLVFLLGCQFCRWYGRRDKKRWASYGTQPYSCNYSSHRPPSHEYDVPRMDQPCLPKLPPPQQQPPPPPPLPPQQQQQGEMEFLDYNGHRILYSHQ